MKKILCLLFAILLMACGNRYSEEMIIVKGIKEHELGQYDLAQYETIQWLGKEQKEICLLKKDDKVLVADAPGKGNFFYEETDRFIQYDGYDVIGVSKNYIILEDQTDGRRYGYQHVRSAEDKKIVFQNLTQYTPFEKLNAEEQNVLWITGTEKIEQ